jgi:hypothetical protein
VTEIEKDVTNATDDDTDVTDVIDVIIVTDLTYVTHVTLSIVTNKDKVVSVTDERNSAQLQ